MKDHRPTPVWLWPGSIAIYVGVGLMAFATFLLVVTRAHS